MERQFLTPKEIEKESMRIIAAELDNKNIRIPEENLKVVMRAIHTTADFDHAKNLYFTEGAAGRIKEELKKGIDIITDTNMCLSGISKKALEGLACRAHYFMADDNIKELAEKEGSTRAYAAFGHAAKSFERAAFVSGNAPTALIRLCELMEEGYRPGFIIAVPVGFVNVVESKEDIIRICEKYGVPAIVARGNKGGSNLAAGIMNSLLYEVI